MSNGSSPRTPRRLSGTLVIVLAALVPIAFAGWLVWRSVGDSEPDASKPAQSAGPAALPPGHSSPTPAASSGRSSPTPSGRATAKKPPGGDNKPGGKPSNEPGPSGPLKGKTVVIDPGHNPNNRNHTSDIARQVDIGTGHKECDTTGTATNSGYAEASFTLDVSHRIRTILEAQGATVKFTQDNNRAYGPCVNERAEIGNQAKADAVVSVHADGAGVGDRGFHVILPARVRGGGADTSAITAPSRDLGERIVGLFVRETSSRPSNYRGNGTGLDVRGDLGGLNLSTVPKVFIECGNMRDPQDAALITSPAWRQKAAQGIASGISSFLKG